VPAHLAGLLHNQTSALGDLFAQHASSIRVREVGGEVFDAVDLLLQRRGELRRGHIRGGGNHDRAERQRDEEHVSTIAEVRLKPDATYAAEVRLKPDATCAAEVRLKPDATYAYPIRTWRPPSGGPHGGAKRTR